MHGLSPRARKLLTDARRVSPPPLAKSAVRQAVASSVAAGVTVAAVEATAASLGASAAGAAAGGKSLLAMVGIWGGVGMVAGLAASAVSLAVLPSASPEPPATTSVVATRASTAAPVARASAAPVAPEPPPAPSVAPASRTMSLPGPSVAQELRLLAEARAALRDGDPERALVLTDRHRARFGAGAMTEEALAARILALCALGRVEEGRAASAQLERLAPSSPQLDGVRAACGRNP